MFAKKRCWGTLLKILNYVVFIDTIFENLESDQDHDCY